MSSQTILGVLGIQVIQLKVKTLKLQVENTRQKSRSDFAGLRFYALKPKSKEREKKTETIRQSPRSQASVKTMWGSLVLEFRWQQSHIILILDSNLSNIIPLAQTGPPLRYFKLSGHISFFQILHEGKDDVSYIFSVLYATQSSNSDEQE